MPALEPGEEYEIGFGKGRTIKANALGYRKVLTLQKLVAKFSESKDGEQQAAAMDDALRFCLPEGTCSEDFLDSLSLETAAEIIQAVFRAAGLSEDERKKSE